MALRCLVTGFCLDSAYPTWTTPTLVLCTADVMVSAMRLLVAPSGLVVVWLDPVEPAQFVPLVVRTPESAAKK